MFLPTWSLKIFEITTGTLCSAPPWKAREKDENEHCWVSVVELPKLLSHTNGHLCNPQPFHFHFSLSIIKTYLLTLMLKPRPPVACLRSTTVLCFRKWEFLIGKKILWTLKQYSGVMQHELQCKPRALGRTYIYLGFTSTCANHIQLLYG